MSQISQNGSINPESILNSLSIVLDQTNASSLPGSTQEFSLQEAISKAFVDPNIEPEEGSMIASIDNTSIATLGDFSCIIGKAKSKKTFFITLLVAAFLKEAIDQIQTYKSAGKTRIVWFDTEQSRNHVFKAYKRALKLSNEPLFHSIEVYSLRPHSPADRLELITHVLTALNPNKDIAFVVIDGIKDLITDILDAEQATNIATWLLKITDEQGLHICNVLHQNKKDNNARGHLGTEIVNKAQTILSVQKETESISSVHAEFCRDKEPKAFAFKIDETSGLPQILTGYSCGGLVEGGTRRSGGLLIPDEIHREIMANVFGFQPEYGYTELVIQAKLQYAISGYEVGDNKIKGFIKHCDNQKIIIKNGKPGSPKAKYIFNRPLDHQNSGLV